MSELQIQRGERGRWRKKKPVVKSMTNRADRTDRADRTLVQKDVDLLRRRAVSMRAGGFVAWSEPKDDE